MQLMTHTLGGEVKRADKREYGEMEVELNTTSSLFKNINENNICLMSHTDYVDVYQKGLKK